MALQWSRLNPAVGGSSNVPSHSEYANQLFDNGMFSDCSVYAGTRRWRLHRTILAQRCQFFRACFSDGFRESRGHRGTSSAEVSMHEDDPDALERMLRWLYTLEYPSIQADPTLDDQDQQHVQPLVSTPSKFWTSELALLVIADKYDLPHLAAQACASIRDTATQSSWKVAESNGEIFPGSIDDFIDMLELLYTDFSSGSSIARTLQESLLQCSAMMIASLALHYVRLSRLVTTIPELTKDLVEALRQTVEAQKTPEHGGQTANLTTSSSRRGSRISGPWDMYRSGSESESSGGGRSPTSRVASRTPTPVKMYIPMNEDSDME